MKNQNSSKAVNDNEILHGLKNEQFQPFFQPKVQCSTKKIVGSEALIRWVHPELGILLPDTFLARLRANKLMPEISNIVINESLKMLQSHQSENFSVPISINIDPDSLLSPSFATTLKKKCQMMATSFEWRHAVAVVSCSWHYLRLSHLLVYPLQSTQLMLNSLYTQTSPYHSLQYRTIEV